MKKSHFLCWIPVVVALFLHAACASSHKIVKPPLDTNSQKFLDIIRYIITDQEEKIFREMPLEDRREFIVDFWARRDPDPSTPENEFRSLYYTRLAVADKAFRTGIPGWMTDQGRIYILLGPPTDVIKKSAGDKSTELSQNLRELSSNLLEEGTFTERPTEIWIYNQYPDYFSGPLRLIFVDNESTGDYKLTTDVEVKRFSMMSPHQSDPNVEKYQWIGEIETDESLPTILPFLDYTGSLDNIEKDREENYSVDCFYNIPLSAIHYRKENAQYVCDLELSLEVRNLEEKSTYREQKEVRKHFSPEKLRVGIKEGNSLNEKIKVPLSRGTNEIYFSLRDRIQQKRLRKLSIVKIKK